MAATTTFDAALDAAATVWDAALLALHRHDSLSETSPRDVDGPDYTRWLETTMERVRPQFEAREDPRLNHKDRDFIRQITAGGTDAVCCFAVAWGIDLETWPHFPRLWRLAVAGDADQYELREGEPYPLSDADLELFHDRAVIARPSSKRAILRGELPHIRRFQPRRGIKVRFDFRFEQVLSGVLASQLPLLASIHPNVDLDELAIEKHAGGTFPIAVKDINEQLERICAGIDAVAAASLPAIVVVPELAATEMVADGVRDFLDKCHAYKPILVVAGSSHELHNGRPSNVSQALLPSAPLRLTHRKLVRFTDELSREGEGREAIEEAEELVIYPSGIYRFGILICKDFLDPEIAAYVAELGVNVLTVPSMSPDTGDFPERVGTFVADTQGIAVVANGPLRWKKRRIVAPAAIFGQPLKGHVRRTWDPEEPVAPSLAAHRAGGRSKTTHQPI